MGRLSLFSVKVLHISGPCYEPELMMSGEHRAGSGKPMLVWASNHNMGGRSGGRRGHLQGAGTGLPTSCYIGPPAKKHTDHFTGSHLQHREASVRPGQTGQFTRKFLCYCLQNTE